MLSESGTSFIEYERKGIISIALVASTNVKPVTSAGQDPLTRTGIPVTVLAGAEVLFGKGNGAEVLFGSRTGADVGNSTGIGADLQQGQRRLTQLHFHRTVCGQEHGMIFQVWSQKKKLFEPAEATH